MDNSKYLGWVLSFLRDDCEITIVRHGRKTANKTIVENATKANIDMKHYGRQWKKIVPLDGRRVGESRYILIFVY